MWLNTKVIRWHHWQTLVFGRHLVRKEWTSTARVTIQYFIWSFAIKCLHPKPRTTNKISAYVQNGKLAQFLKNDKIISFRNLYHNIDQQDCVCQPFRDAIIFRSAMSWVNESLWNEFHQLIIHSVNFFTESGFIFIKMLENLKLCYHTKFPFKKSNINWNVDPLNPSGQYTAAVW